MGEKTKSSTKNASSNTSSDNRSMLDADSKLKQYMLINHQISKTLTTQRITIAQLKECLKANTSDIIDLQLENHRLKVKYNQIKQMYITHLQLLTNEIQSNFEKIENLPDGCSTQEPSTKQPHQSLSTSLITTGSRCADDSRRESKSFDSNKNESERKQDSYDGDMTPIVEEEDENSTISSSAGVNNSNVSSDDSRVSEKVDETGQSDEETDSSEGSQNNQTFLDGNDNDEETDESDEDNDESLSGNDESDGEESQNDESEDSNSDNDDSIQQTNESGCAASDLISIRTNASESTIPSDNSDEENNNVDKSAPSIIQISHSMISVDSQSFDIDKSTTQKSIKTLPANKKNLDDNQSASVVDKSIDSAFESLISSTPYKQCTTIDETLVDAEPKVNASNSRSNASNASAMMSQVSKASSGVTSNESQSTSSLSSRPRRRAAPVMLSEPKLNTKLRRPRQ